MKIENVIDVARWRLCTGCGACVAVCPHRKIRLVNVLHDGIRPRWAGRPNMSNPTECAECSDCLDVCPGIALSIAEKQRDSGGLKPLAKQWGHVLEIWEAHATDPKIRYRGSSGGLCTALSLFCLERGRAGGVLHTGVDPDNSVLNRTCLSRSKAELLDRTGSRYSPASPCEGIGQVMTARFPSVFVGKPCDVAGLTRACRHMAGLEEKIALTVGFFCAGTPSTQGTIELLARNGIEANEVGDLRYRGMGWPGLTMVHFKGRSDTAMALTYEEAWGFIQKFRPFRCYLCPDLTAEAADISVGDPWYREIGEGEPGRSLVLIRTQRGLDVFREAMAGKFITAERGNLDILLRSQNNLLGKRQAIWGRLLAMRILGIPCPRLNGFHLFANWTDLPAGEKVKSVLGTIRRIMQRRYFRPTPIIEDVPR